MPKKAKRLRWDALCTCKKTGGIQTATKVMALSPFYKNRLFKQCLWLQVNAFYRARGRAPCLRLQGFTRGLLLIAASLVGFIESQSHLLARDCKGVCVTARERTYSYLYTSPVSLSVTRPHASMHVRAHLLQHKRKRHIMGATLRHEKT